MDNESSKLPPLHEEAAWQFLDFIFDCTPIEMVIINELRGNFVEWSRALDAVSEDSDILDSEQKERLDKLHRFYHQVRAMPTPIIPIN